MAPEETTHGTFGCERTVLVVARTVTSTGRLLEAVRFFRNDFRVNVIFTVNDTSPYSSGVHRLLREAGVEHIVPWSQVRATPHALALSASENVDFDHLKATTVVLPHGIGFNKYVPDPATGGTRLAGLPSRSALRSGQVRLVLAHETQEKQLRQVCPEVEGHTAVTGDPTYEQLLACLPLRERYRRRLGLDGRELVLLSSTWRTESELGRWRTLPKELLASLPADEYQVAVAMHPNIWSWYGTLQVRTWFSDALDAGLLLIPPTQGWQAALLAADLVVGDHGSVTLYAAALGKPVLLAAFGDEIVPGTPIEELGRGADHLDPRKNLRDQAEHALARHDPERFEPLARTVFAHVGESTRLLRDLLYRELDLTPPEGEVPLVRVPDAEPDRRTVTAFDVDTEFTGTKTITMRRYPMAARSGCDWSVRPPPAPGTTRHLAVEEDEPHLNRPQVASVLVRRESTEDGQAAAWSVSALRDYPGSRVAAAATPTGCVAKVRNGPFVQAGPAGTRVDPMILASAVYACVLEGRVDDGAVTVRAGKTEVSLALTVVNREDLQDRG